MRPHPTSTGHGFLHVPGCHGDGDAHGDKCKVPSASPLWGPSLAPRPGEAGTRTSPPLTSSIPQFGNIEGITTAILDEFPGLRDWRRKTAFLAVLCISFYLLGLLLVTQVWGPLHPYPAAPSTLG